ncbi:MAG: hypothetical protein ACOYY2_14960 [Actinomycetota bacterium]
MTVEGQPHGWTGRTRRALPTAAVTLALSTAGHLLAGGAAPSPSSAAAAAGGAWFLSRFLVRRPRTLPRVLTSLAVAQVGLDEILCSEFLSGSLSGPGPAHTCPELHPAMLVAHAAATVALAVMLTRAEPTLRHLLALLAWLVPVLPRPDPALLVGHPTVPLNRADRVRRPRRRALLAASPFRGPPVGHRVA